MSCPDVLIIGCGGHGRAVAELLGMLKGVRPLGFADGEASRIGTTVAGLEVMCTPEEALERFDATATSFLIAIGHNPTRRNWYERFVGAGFETVTLVHPAARVSPTASLGGGSVVLAGATVATGARIGQNVILGTGCVVDHDVVVDDHAHVAAGAVLGGGAHLGEGAWVGVGAVVAPLAEVHAGEELPAGISRPSGHPSH